MSKELFVTSTPRETKLAVVEDDQLVEVFFERENEYTLAGSIYKGKVTRVLPGMQSAFVDIGLDRDAFLYVTDFLEEVENDEDEAAPAQSANAQQSESGETRGNRDDRGNREERGGRGRGGRDRGGRDRGRRSEQHRSAQASELKPADESAPEFTHESGQSESDGNAVDGFETAGEVQGGEESQSQSQPQQAAGERVPRRWRGRRGRRRGRSFGSGREASSDQPQSAEDDQSEQSSAAAPEDSSHAQSHPHDEPETHSDREPGDNLRGVAPVEETHPSAQAAHGGEPPEHAPEDRAEPVRHSREDRGNDRERQPQRPQRILLPGESLAKYNPRTESATAEKKAEPVVESRFQKIAPRPSTEVAVTPGSLSAGVLAGESLAKYRNRGASPVSGDVSTEKEAPKPEAASEISAKHHSQQVERKDDTEPETHSHPAHAEAREESQVPSAATPPEQHEERGPYGFSPGSGVIEEEEIVEEEQEAHTESEKNFEEGDYEELEEETLEEEEEPESKLIAASEGLAAALMENRDPTRVRSYADEETDEDEGEGEEESSAADSSVEDYDDEREEVEEEALTLEGGYDGPDMEEPEADPEDPDYSGRAETRGPSPTAGLQQRQDRGDRGSERGRRGGRRGNGRPQRGGRPMRGGGPRRNIPRGPLPQINDLLKEGQEILVQIAKEPMAKKGARITSHIALPGRFLVFMPTVNHTGVSRKIGSEEERQRLKRILISEKGQAHGGFIVRTAATGASEEDLRADIRFLINLWNEIKQRAETSKAPALIYHDLNLVERILRDQVTTTFSQIWVDNENEYERILRFASRFQPSLVRRVKLYSKETPLFEEFSIQDEINKALKSKVWLKSGGYIVINQTEALVAIDINTGKYVGKTTRLEDTIVKTNIDAIKEIVRQIRLRDLGGIIVIDFIDMDERKNRQRVMQALEEALKSDRSPSKVLQFNDFGLVAITRKRVKQSLERTLGTQCTYCTGTGMIKSVATICNEIYVELRKMSKHFDTHQVTLRVNPEVGKALKDNGGKWLLEMEELTKKTILVKNDPAQHQEQFDIH